MGVCVKNSWFGPVLAGGERLCTGSSQCGAGEYCNDE